MHPALSGGLAGRGVAPRVLTGLLLAPILAGCAAPLPAPEAAPTAAPVPPESPAEVPAGPSGASGAGPGAAPGAPPAAAEPRVPRNHSWSGEVALGTPGPSLGSDPEPLDLRVATALEVTLAFGGPGPLRLDLRRDRGGSAAPPVASAEGTSPVTLRADLGAGTYFAWVANGDHGASVNRAYRATASWSE